MGECHSKKNDEDHPHFQVDEQEFGPGLTSRQITSHLSSRKSKQHLIPSPTTTTTRMSTSEEEIILSYEIIHNRIGLITFLHEDETETFSWGTRKCEHRINPIFVSQLSNILDEILTNSQVSIVIITGKGKFFCNGMDLQYIATTQNNSSNNNKINELQKNTEILLAKLLCFPLPTIAGINGHFCAAGAMFGFAFDYRIMTYEKGLCFVPGIDLGLVYTMGMTNLMKSKLPTHLHMDFIIYGTRYNAIELEKEKIILKATSLEELVPTCITHALELTKKERFLGDKYRDTMFKIKRNTYRNAYDSLMDSSTNFQGMGFETGQWDEHGRSKI